VRAIHWFRSDLRLRDNTGLAAAAARADELALVFVLDDALLATAGAPRLRFLLASLEQLGHSLAERGQTLLLRRGDPVRELAKLVRESRAELLTFNRDPSPYARRRDTRVRTQAERAGARVVECKDRVLFESRELRTGAGTGFRVYTPFRRAWRARLHDERPAPAGPLRLPRPIPKLCQGVLPTASSLGVGSDRTDIPRAGERTHASATFRGWTAPPASRRTSSSAWSRLASAWSPHST
jgi:deoxyribodipyrimidine photo-lyase